MAGVEPMGGNHRPRLDPSLTWCDVHARKHMTDRSLIHPLLRVCPVRKRRTQRARVKVVEWRKGRDLRDKAAWNEKTQFNCQANVEIYLRFLSYDFSLTLWGDLSDHHKNWIKIRYLIHSNNFKLLHKIIWVDERFDFIQIRQNSTFKMFLDGTDVTCLQNKDLGAIKW